MRSRRERGFIFFTFFTCCAGVAFLGAALGTDHWVEAAPRRNATALRLDATFVLLDDGSSDRFHGLVHFGLFRGEKVLDAGLGSRGREKPIAVFADYVQAGMFSYGLWVTTIVAACIAILWGLVAATFAIVNTATRPAETVTGPTGLYLWNSLAMLFGAACAVLWVVHYYQYLRHNVIVPADRDNYWTSEGRTSLAWSFWLVPAASLTFLVNLVAVALAGGSGQDLLLRPFKKGNSANLNDKNIDMVIMY